MSDSQSSYGDPVDEPTDAERDADVVGRAHEGLAEAEAARRDLPSEEEMRSAEPVGAPAAHESVVAEKTAAEPSVSSDLDDDDARWARYAASADVPERDDTARAEAARADATHAQAERVDDAPTVVAPAATGAVTASEPAVAPSPYGGAQPIFVQAPEAPRPRGNRGTAGAIGLLAALLFAVLYLAATLGLHLLTGDLQISGLADAALAALTTWSLWVPVVVFYLAFWFLGALVNRGRWGHWVVWGLLVGVAAYGGHLLGQAFQAPFWMLTGTEGAQLLQDQALAPLAIVAFVLGRELTIWFGAWVAARGRRVSELNDEAQREYERTLEAGPQLHRA
ncbi:ABC transporter [Microbacterium sp. NPDC091313]